MVESDEGVRTVGVVVTVTSLHDDSLSLPCDAVSETRLCVSSKPSSLSSGCAVLVCLIMSRGGLIHIRSGVSKGDLRLRLASRTSSGLMELSLRPTMPIRAMTRCLVGSIVVGDVDGGDASLCHRSDGSLAMSVADCLLGLDRSPCDSSAVLVSVVFRCLSVRRAAAWRSKLPSPSGSTGSMVSGLTCRAFSSMVFRCRGLGVSSFRQGTDFGATLTMGDDGFDDFFR